MALLAFACHPAPVERHSTRAERNSLTARRQAPRMTKPEGARPGPARPGAAGVSANISDAELRARIGGDFASLGSLSLGRPNNGALLNGVRLQDGPFWHVLYPDRAWATAETLAQLKHALRCVNARFDGHTQKARIGDLSAEHGGLLHPHKSHQSGRDVDLSYYRIDPANRWYAPATADSLDRRRTWALLRCLLEKTNIELIFVDRSLQVMLMAHARASGEDPNWLRSVFEIGSRGGQPIILHEPEHRNHLHLRFRNNKAQQLGQRALPYLVGPKERRRMQ